MARLLSRGTTGADVKELQAALNFHLRKPAAPLVPDGQFGPKTELRVRDFQKRASIKVDGLVGPDTVRLLYRRVGGAVVATVTRHEVPTAGRPIAVVGRGAGATRSALLGMPRLGQVAPGNPDFIPPSQRLPQTRAVTSPSFDAEHKVLFNPLAEGDDGEHPFRLTLSPNLPWPIFLPEPLKLEIESTGGVRRFQLDGKLKLPFKLLPPGRLELNPYFFVGAGVNQDHFKEINAGAGTSVRLKLLNNIGGTGVSLSLEADGGVKYNHDPRKNEGQWKGVFEGGALLEFPFNFF